jgi:hypothetical protein
LQAFDAVEETKTGIGTAMKRSSPGGGGEQRVIVGVVSAWLKDIFVRFNSYVCM